MNAFTMRELAREAEREVGYRRWVYPKLVQKGQPPSVLDRRLAMMEVIADRLRQEAETEEAAERLL
jgi:hypothetical protein